METELEAGGRYEGGRVGGKLKGANVVWVLQGSRSRGRESWGLREESTLTSGRDRKRTGQQTLPHTAAVSLALYPLVLPALTLG